MIRKINGIVFLYFFVMVLFSSLGNTTEEYAEKTGKSCAACHLDSSGGGELTKAGEDYRAQLMSEDETGQSQAEMTSKSSASKLIRLLVGFIHIITGIFWFGTILYVHLILKPAYAAHGLPKGEVKLGLFSMVIMGISGILLTLYRIPSLSILYETRFGVLLLIKIALFLMMVFTALFVVLILGPKLKAADHSTHKKGKLSISDLKYFDGTRGRAGYIGYKNRIYDMSASEFWTNGVHFERHKAGEDLSDMLNQAPHDEEKVLKMPFAGELALSKKDGKPLKVKVFYFLAYFNLAIVLLITLVLALWRWW
jgi:predicted heme/steroid binding protein